MKRRVTKQGGARGPAAYTSAMDSQRAILIVDDDAAIRSLLAEHMEQHGFACSVAENARQARERLDRGHFDLIVLDIMMPGEDGLSLCRDLRSGGHIPIILLTAVSGETDRIIGLEMGADDYLTKPFSPRELVARIRAVLRRVDERLPVHRHDQQARYRFDGWVLTPGARELTDPDGTLVPLTAGEFDLLLAFLRQPNQVLTRDHLLDATRGRAANAFDRSVDVQLSRLRRKIETDPTDPHLIKTVRGGGYLFSAQVSA